MDLLETMLGARLRAAAAVEAIIVRFCGEFELD